MTEGDRSGDTGAVVRIVRARRETRRVAQRTDKAASGDSGSSGEVGSSYLHSSSLWDEIGLASEEDAARVRALDS